MCSHKNLRAVVYSVAGFLHVKGCKAQPEINLTHFSRSQMQHWTQAQTRRERFSLCKRIGLVRRKKVSKKVKLKKYFLLNLKGLKNAFSASSSYFIGGEPAPHSGLEYVLQRLYN